MSPTHHSTSHNLLPRPPYEPQIASLLTQLRPTNTLILSSLPDLRAQTSPSATDAIGNRPLIHLETQVSSLAGHAIPISIFKRSSSPPPPPTSTPSASTLRRRPCILHIHGGGTVSGNRYLALSEVLDWVVELDVVAVSIEYRLAPEAPFPAGLEDCEDVLRAIMDGEEEFGVDGGRVCVVAGSGGAVLAGGLVLKMMDEERRRKSREGWQAGAGEQGSAESTAEDGRNERCLSKIRGMLLYSPMLDHRCETTSSKQFFDVGLSDCKSAQTFWSWYLGGEKGQYDASTVNTYASPGTQPDLSDFPSTYLDVGSCEAYRDEAVQFANTLWSCGANCELHVWPGGCHIFSVLCPDLQISKDAVRARRYWITKTLCGADSESE